MALASGSTSAAAEGTLEGASLTTTDTIENGRPCPRSSYRLSQGGSSEALGLVLGGLLTTFASKAVDGFIGWLEKRKDRLDGTRSATFTGEFYDPNDGSLNAKCFIFTAGTFDNSGIVNPKVYAEFVPVIYDDTTYTLKPVFLSYRDTVAEARKKAKFTSFAITVKYNTPKSKNDKGEINSFEISDGAAFTYTFGKLVRGTELDYKALEGAAAGLGALAPRVTGSAGGASVRPIAYQMSAVWSETAEPSPLYTAAVGSLSDNKATIGEEIGNAIKEVLGNVAGDDDARREGD
ncbi:hypothetical protein ETX26_00025 [Pelagerythrobacter rhizovicinus]|uniref:Uncharacterized protein n=1 Tax=Pelagerythrobacter rhizovicinus TaxID=2268576 RepID=A0A4V1QW77_9SPHN|nr:hypothetical protein ETX26_00025 [Pelagerythrobacter rhizovicinus]